MERTIRLVTPIEKRAEERQAFWRTVLVACGAVGFALVLVGAGIYHVDQDRALSAKYAEALYTIKSQRALIDAAQKLGREDMVIKLANLPPTAMSYQLVLVPRPEGEAR